MAVISTIGTTGTFATLSDWILSVPFTLDNDYVAEILPEAHSDNISLTGITGGAYKLIIRPHATSPYHYGVASSVSGGIGATLEQIDVATPLITFGGTCSCDIYNLEFRSYTDGTAAILDAGSSGAITITFYRNIFHGIDNGSSNAGNRAIRINDTDVTCIFYRNIFYGLGGQAILLSNFGAGTRIVQNTAYYCGRAGSLVNFNFNNTAGSADVAVRNNVSLYPAPTSADYVRSGTITWTANYRTTAGGGGGAGTFTLTSPGTEMQWARSAYDETQVRCLLEQGAQLIGAGTNTYGTTYFPGIRLNDQYPVGSTQPDVGADEYEPDRGDRPWGYRPWMDTRRIGIRGNRPGYYDEAPGWP